jgi:DNA-binding MarR family transcriptional regulator
MVARGWVERRTAPCDDRGVILVMTRVGRDVADRLERARAERLRALLEAIPVERRDTVIEVLVLMEEAARASDPYR